MAQTPSKIEICYRHEDGTPSEPLAHQKEFHEALLVAVSSEGEKNKYVMCGGDYGAGKTAMLIIEALRQSFA